MTVATGLDPDIAEIKKVTRAFVEREVDPFADTIEDDDEVPAALLRAAGELGLMGIGIPEKYGGLGLSMVGRCAVYEELGRAHNGFTTVVGAHTGIGSVGIAQFGTEEQRARFLPGMARGETIAAFALSEPEAGSDAGSLQTHAERSGDHYVVNGTKHFCTNGAIAQVFTVMARTEPGAGNAGVTSFLIEAGTPGFRVGRVEPTMGLRGSHSAELIFEECRVPAANVLGQPGEGFRNALKILNRGRVGLAARNLGACTKLVELAVAHAEQRVQFGVPIIEHQAVAHMLADMALETELLRAFVYRVAALVDEGTPCIKEASMAKLFGSEAFGRVADRAVQVFGSAGYVRGNAVERFYRDARVTRIYEGTSEIQRNIIAAQLRRATAQRPLV